MKALLIKEISSFFNSITGYLVISVFLTINGLFLWVIPGNMNVIFGGYSTLESLFYMAPWVYLFLVPAITMRLFSEEKKAGTIELLLTRPIHLFEIVLAKYLAGLVLVTLSLLPTLVYFYTVYQMGNPIGNIDMGATWGSYLGLVLLAAVYVAIGVFSSSLTSNQIVAFITGTLLCFLFYYGFESLTLLPSISESSSFFTLLGIDAHYNSMSRGVIDSRDLVYFFSVIALFLFSTKMVIEIKR